MKNEVTVMNNELPADITKMAWTDDQKKLIKNTVARGQSLTDDEFLLFAYRCKVMGLNPLLGHIYPIKFNDNQTGGKTLSFITSIDAFRTIAANTGELAGIGDYTFDEGLTQYEMLMKFKGKKKEEKIIPKTATCTVNRIKQGIICPSTSTIRFSDYLPQGKGRAAMWWRFPFLMSGKTAEALSHRKAFPVQLTGVYTEEEMEQASELVVPIGNTEENIDIVHEINEAYDIMNLQTARRIDLNMQFTGMNELIYAPHEKLIELLDYCKTKIGRMDNENNDI
jgi:phage recombination protein Bet